MAEILISSDITNGDIVHLSMFMRPADVTEVMLSHGHTPEEAVINAVRTSRHAYRVTANGSLICMFGVCDDRLAKGTGVPWMLSKPSVTKYPTHIMRIGLRTVKSWMREYDLLMNAVWAGNDTSIRWLKRIGFEFGDPVALGPQQAPFYAFFKARRVKACVNQ